MCFLSMLLQNFGRHWNKVKYWFEICGESILRGSRHYIEIKMLRVQHPLGTLPGSGMTLLDVTLLLLQLSRRKSHYVNHVWIKCFCCSVLFHHRKHPMNAHVLTNTEHKNWQNCIFSRNYTTDQLSLPLVLIMSRSQFHHLHCRLWKASLPTGLSTFRSSMTEKLPLTVSYICHLQSSFSMLPKAALIPP